MTQAWCVATVAAITMSYLGSDLGSKPPKNRGFFLLVCIAPVPLCGFGAVGLNVKKPGLRLGESRVPTPVRGLCHLSGGNP